MGFAEGLSNGVNLGLRLVNAKESQDRQKKFDDRQDKQWADEDAQKDAVKRANEAAMTAYQNWAKSGDQPSAQQTSSPASQTTPTEAPAAGGMTLGGGVTTDGPLTLGGATPSFGQPADVTAKPTAAQQMPRSGGGMSLGGGVTTDGKLTLGGGVPSFGQPADVTDKPTAAQQAPQPEAPPVTQASQQLPQSGRPVQRDEREGILAGMQARRKALMNEKVDPKLWMDDWGKEANLRAQIRGEKIDNAEKRFLATGDPGEYARTVYPLIDDGMDFVGSRQVKDDKGNPAWEFVRRDQQTGKQITNVMNADQFQRFMMGARDPNAVIQYEAKSMLERMKTDQKIRKDAADQEGVRETNRQKSKLTLGEIAARSSGEMAVTKEKGKQDRTTQRDKPVVLSEGATAFGQEDTPNGTRLVPIAKGSTRASARYSAKDLNQMVIDNYGVSDMSGKAMGSDATARISAAAEILLRSNANMGANEAIAKASSDLGFNIKPKN